MRRTSITSKSPRTDGPCRGTRNRRLYGYSSGKWKGETLAVQTIGFRDDVSAQLMRRILGDRAKAEESEDQPWNRNRNVTCGPRHGATR
jgi:hypothetical protein